MSRALVVFLVLAVLGLAAIPLFDSPFYTAQFSRILVYAIFAMSLDLLVGYTGLVSLGHAAFFGIAAYTGAVMAEKLGMSNILIGLPSSLLAAAMAAVVIGVLALRTSGVYFIMVTLAFAQMIFFVVYENDFFGGSNGLLVFADLEARVGSWVLLDVDDPINRYYFTLAAAILVFVGLARLVRSPFGKVIQGIRVNEQRMRALGYPVGRYKLVCFVIAGTLAGLAGYLYFLLTGFVDPTIIDWLHSAQLLMIVILGGIGSLLGPALGAMVLIIFIDQTSEITDHWKLYVGILVIAVTLYARGGFFGVAAQLLEAVRQRRKTNGGVAGWLVRRF